ncbi:ATP-dependent DNA helicase DinG [Pilibacter termitis]|uniref:3'-5' exonuclease DinG n=1 Tax=Pilibacter termitis TaxID=263852 RepID=A0A1T4MYP5_9ENTE|nr:helicase C-terminal domain-containing protein [Pilibacter termitis]SJZ71758.1 ATP-dependent DNA helicase DinG [Pilibacter termitis]
MSKTTYAVVDLETTGTNATEDRIIQIGIVLVENGRVVSTYATDVNPEKTISPVIQELTGISNEQVKNAPIFEDIAPTIHSLLAETVFVAHNIHFDFNFLNNEFERVGLPLMKNAGVDTVELSQIFFPTLESYRLSDLSQYFGFVHENPHQADSDALVTADLLLEIEKKIMTIPLHTLEQIVRLSDVLAFESQAFLQHRLERRRLSEGEHLPEHLHENDGLILRNKEVQETLFFNQETYPKTKKQKLRLYGAVNEYRDEQARFMNMVYKHFHENPTEKNLFIEAATGIGKTLGYLLPLAFLATKEEKAVIATPSILLQEQLMQEVLPKMEQFLPNKLHATLVKSARHYIDLVRFKESLLHPKPQKQYRLYQMATLVWLLETQTGDLEELNQTSYTHFFYEDIRHRGIRFLNPLSPLYVDDFLCAVKEKIGKSNLLIVNHAYLVNENVRGEFALPKAKYLIVDEAHHLPNTLLQLSSARCNLQAFMRELKSLFEDKGVLEVVEEEIQEKLSQTILRRVQLLRFSLSNFDRNLEHLSVECKKIAHGNEEIFMNEEQIEQLNIEKEIFLSQLAEIWQIAKEIETELFVNIEQFSSYEQYIMTPIFDFTGKLEEILMLFTRFFSEENTSLVKWLTNFTKTQSITLHLQDFERSMLDFSTWYARFEKVLFTSGTMKIGNNKKFLPTQLGIEQYGFRTIPSPFDYGKQAKLFLPTDLSENGELLNKEQLSQAILKILENTEKSTLVLFSSKEMLTDCYNLLQPELFKLGKEILAQDISGSKEKIMKRFRFTKGAALFGTDSYWDGVDLPGDVLELLIVTKLPFENPLRPFVKSYYDYLSTKGLSPFSSLSLPKAALRLRQGLGRLIRSSSDRGVMFILDDRILTKGYGTRLLAVFPKDMEKNEGKLEDLVEKMREFLL